MLLGQSRVCARCSLVDLEMLMMKRTSLISPWQCLQSHYSFEGTSARGRSFSAVFELDNPGYDPKNIARSKAANKRG